MRETGVLILIFLDIVGIAKVERSLVSVIRQVLSEEW
ncbi:hypothetical protein SAMD00079811_07850 [Scytonema sp. HK-05]|nr:hypothetical protein SAMD00079811_07850 [Scytonema sp. HK-05]